MDFIPISIDDVFTILGALHIIAAVIVNATPTPKDNEWLGKTYRVVEIFAGILTRRAKL